MRSIRPHSHALNVLHLHRPEPGLAARSATGATLLDDLLDFEEAVELADAGWMTHFAEGFGFDLADAFAGDAELFADFFQSARVAIAEAESQFENFSFAFGKAAEDVGELVFEKTEAGDFGGVL